MSKYEISLWEDVYRISDSNNNEGSYYEQKVCIIGSDTMTSQARARNPKLVTKLDGTSTLTFDIYYCYIDTVTGEEIHNPYVSYLVNERKVKAFWKNKWYDFFIKDIKEDSVSRVFSYTCEDAFITELSRTGFNLEFNTELQNNIGTAEELITTVLEDSEWQFQEGEPIYQTVQESVFEITTTRQFSAIEDPDGTTQIVIPAAALILVHFSNVADENNFSKALTFWYANGEPYERIGSNMEVTNGNCYHVDGIKWAVVTENNSKYAVAKLAGNEILRINLDAPVSSQYAAIRYVNSQKTQYSTILERYVNIYRHSGNNQEYLGFSSTDYTNPQAVVNLVTNPDNFENLNGWIFQNSDAAVTELVPDFDSSTDLETYDPVSYIRFVRKENPDTNAYIANRGIIDNKSYISEGFSVGDHYIFKVKAAKGTGSFPYSPLEQLATITPIVAEYNILQGFVPGTQYFTVESRNSINGYFEYEMRCIKSCSIENIEKKNIVLFLQIKAYNSDWTCHLQEAQFFKKVMGLDANNNEIRIDPGAIENQGIVKTTWKYYPSSYEDEKYTKDTLEYSYVDDTEWDLMLPVYTDYEKTGTIEASQSNRFNILQDIAEKFQCWVKFYTEHEEDGSISQDENNRPKKYVTLLREIGKETSINFVYGLDLQGITRNLQSSTIATKIIVPQNNNEFGENGFCSIARSPWNYTRENVIYNFDYYVNQGLLDQAQLESDLYGADGYFVNLHNNNKRYDELTKKLAKLQMNLIRLESQKELYNQYVSATQEQKQNKLNYLYKLSGTRTLAGLKTYINAHANNTTVKTNYNDYIKLDQKLTTLTSQLAKITRQVNTLSTQIDTLEADQSNIIRTLENCHYDFYKKYSRFIQEGVWNSEDYWDDTKYYMDALSVAYESSRPQVSYEIQIIRLSDLEDFSSKIFDLGDICTIQDVRYFGYEADKVTPHKERVFISEITSNFDEPSKDSFTVQNYKTKFDDLFQRITAATQQLEFSEGKYAKAADIITEDGVIKYSVLQDTFDQNRDIVMGSINESVQIDNKGITVGSNNSAAEQVRITSGGIFITNDGGATWKNAIRGDGMSADVINSGSINTEQISIFGSDAPSFVWNDKGINAYLIDEDNATDFSQFVRFDKYGIYGITLPKTEGSPQDFEPESEDDIFNSEYSSYGLTWNRFFMKSGSDDGSIEISSDNNILVRDGNDQDRVRIGDLQNGEYGILIYNEAGDPVFYTDSDGVKIDGSVYIGSFTVDEIVDVVDGVDEIVDSMENAFVADTLHRLATSASSGVTRQTAGWDINTELTPTNRFLWIYHTYERLDGTIEHSTPTIYGVYGQDGESPIWITIDSSAGDIFINNSVSTILRCYVYKGNIDITHDNNYTITYLWEKINLIDGSIDEGWEPTPVPLEQNAIRVTVDDVTNKAVFQCTVEVEEQ